MKTSLTLYGLLFSSSLALAQNANTAVNTWTNFSNSANAYGCVSGTTKPLQYNDELDAVSFIQRNSASYPVTPPTGTLTQYGAVVAMISGDWGQTWDSTCIWANPSIGARYPQGGIYNPPSNTLMTNAYVVGTGPDLDQTLVWAGNWTASKQIGPGNYNTTASTTSLAQQHLSAFAPYPPFGICHFAKYSFSNTDDGMVHSLGEISDRNSPYLYLTGAMVLNGTFNAGVFNWSGQTINCPARLNNSGLKVIYPEPLMAWNESGTVGYVVFLASKLGATKSNVGCQPIVFKTLNSGSSWSQMPSIDFNSPDAQPVKSHLQPMNSSTVIAPYFYGAEGWDLAVDKNDQLHIGCLINSSGSSHADSAWVTPTYGSEAYKWPHTPGRRPYLYDFIFDNTNTWKYGIVDSLPTEAPGIWGLDPGNAYNPWGPNNIPSNARIQLSRTPDGKYIVFTWTESDTASATNGLNWNSYPDIKARLLDGDNLLLSPTEINISQGPNTNVSGRATLHFVSPRSSSATTSAGSVDIKLPVTISNNPAFSPSIDCTHWFTSALLSFSTTGMIPFTGTIASVGIAENKGPFVSWAQLYPNPANDYFNLSLDHKINETTSIEIVNNLGQIVYLAKQDIQNAKHDVSQLSPGVYFVCIGSGNKTANFKLIKE